jgi:hypothetical protein
MTSTPAAGGERRRREMNCSLDSPGKAVEGDDGSYEHTKTEHQEAIRDLLLAARFVEGLVKKRKNSPAKTILVKSRR